MAEYTQVLLKFVTKLPEEFRVPESAVAVPVSVKRYGLSQTINMMLGLDPPRPFDFLINDQLLRSTIQQHLLDNEMSAETTIEVEYIPAVVPPKPEQSTPHDDWVSTVDAHSSSLIVSGSYDGNIRVWDGDLQCQATVAAHTGGVNSLSLLPSSQGQGLMVSAGKDQRVCLWKVAPAGGKKGAWSCRLLAQYQGHGDAVEGVAVNPAGTRMVSCGWDGSLLLWRTGEEVEAAAEEASQGAAPPAATKKRKVAADGQAEASGSAAITESASGRLEGHLHCVSSACWPTQGSLYSGGWDHSVRRWDVATGINVETYNGSKVVASVASCSSSPDVVAFGGSDRCLRVWDSRTSRGEALAVQTLASHSNWINCVRWSPSSSHHVATASHDHTVKLWDIRSTVPLATLSAHSDKALCVAWVPGTETVPGGAASVVSGSADCSLQLYASSNDAAASA